MTRRQVLVALVAIALPIVAVADNARWPADRARSWYAAHPWLIGCNFLPSTAVNDVEMWQTETFDPATIDCELGWTLQWAAVSEAGTSVSGMSAYQQGVRA